MVATTRIRMTRAEYLAQPESMQPGELIDGELITSPTPVDQHQEAVGATYAHLYTLKLGGTLRLSPLDVHLDDEVIVQPDVFWVAPEGACARGDDGCWHGAPDLVIEVLSPSNRKYDRKTKYALYQKYGVREYWILDPDERLLEPFALRDGSYVALGVFEPGETFASPLLNVPVTVTRLFSAA